MRHILMATGGNGKQRPPAADEDTPDPDTPDSAPDNPQETK